MKKTLIIIGLIFLSLTIVQVIKSFAVFETKIEGESNLKIAKWHIFVNNDDLNSTNKTFKIDNISYTDKDGKPVDKFAPGVTGTFIIIIDPKDTEVSFEYDLSLDLENQTYDQIMVDKVEGINGTQLTEENGHYKRIISLQEIQQGKTDSIQVTFHWAWNDANNEKDSLLGQNPDSQFLIPVIINFTQYTE